MKKIQLAIPEPCHENWEQMTPHEKGRFCGACQKTVVDFSIMSDREIAEFFKKPVGSVCGHVQKNQLDRDILFPRKRIPWIRYFFQISLPALLVSAKAGAQGKIAVRGETVCVVTDNPKPKDSVTVIEKKLLEGKVMDAMGRPIPGAAVVIRGSKEAVATNDSGVFKIRTVLNAKLDISSLGYMVQTRTVSDFTTMTITMEPSDVIEMGIIVTVKKTGKKKESIPLVKKIMDTAFKSFSVFPNPTRNNSYLTIDCNRLENGEYVLSLIDMSGEVLHTREIAINDKKKTTDFYLREAKPGTYLIHLFNRRTTASYTEKIIVQ